VSENLRSGIWCFDREGTCSQQNSQTYPDNTVTGTTRFLNDGDALVGEYDGTTAGGTGTLLQRYVHGADGQADDPIARYAGSRMNNGTLWRC